MTVEWAGRQLAIAGRSGAALVRRLWQTRVLRRTAGRFYCHTEEQIDESCPPYQDRFLCVQMAGHIIAPDENTDTDVRIDLLDITAGSTRAEQVLSTAEQWRHSDSPVFFHQAHNGVIPARHAVLANPVTVVRIPLHLLRFARRGRRRIQVGVSVVSRTDGQVLARAEDSVEYVAGCEGYIDIQLRRESVLRASVELACAVAAEGTPQSRTAEVIERWIQDKTRRFKPCSNIAEPLTHFQQANASIDADAACECLLAGGQKTDLFAAMDLILHVAGLQTALSCQQEQMLWALAEKLEIPQERFMALCQKQLLTETCTVDRWRLLLGIRGDLPADVVRRRLNEEYRRWNARVTHSDPRIRRQADIILSLLAEVRSRQHQVVGACAE